MVDAIDVLSVVLLMYYDNDINNSYNSNYNTFIIENVTAIFSQLFILFYIFYLYYLNALHLLDEKTLD